MAFTNGLTDAQTERLALLCEELGEAQHAIGKVLRHGYNSFNPEEGPGSDTNRNMLEREAGDILAALDLIVAARDIDGERMEKSRSAKHDKLPRYLHHQPASLLRHGGLPPLPDRATHGGRMSSVDGMEKLNEEIVGSGGSER